MLYAPVNANAWLLEWKELEYLEKKLRRLNSSYQVITERRMFELRDVPEHRFVLVKWHNPKARGREVVLETHDIKQMVSALVMLISIEEEHVDAYKH